MVSHLFIEGVLLDGQRTNVIVTDNIITGIGSELPMPVGSTYIDGSQYAAFPSFANMHTHAPMTLLRGLGDDTPLDEWLNKWIWPTEKRLNPDSIYWGTRLACLEMIKSGTTAFNDMYFFLPEMAKAVSDSGIRAQLGLNLFGDGDELDSFNPEPYPNVTYSIAPHAIYTVTKRGLTRAAEYCSRNGLAYHIHMNETLKEVSDCQSQHGCRPYELLDRIGVLDTMGEKLIGAHSLHLSEHEIELIGRHGCTVVHNPNSNLKLGSGYRFLFSELADSGANVTIGTDGCASSNNLDMLEAAKTAALLQKGWRQSPTASPARDIMQAATENGFRALGLKAGRIAEGWLADMILVDLDNVAFVPCHNAMSNLVYSAHSDAIDTVICNGKIVMRNRQVANEAEIVANARKYAKDLVG